MVKVSIIIPVYNVAKYLCECLDSVIGQTLREIEIICIDDGSTDSSPEILDRYAETDARIRVVHKKNTGYGHSMNIGFSMASGEYIGIVESDDFADCRMFERLFEVARQHSAEVVKSNYVAYQKDLKEKATFVNLLSNCIYGRIFSPDACRDIVQPGTIWTAIYQRSFIEKNQITFNETPGASYQDVSFAFKVYACAKRFFCVREGYLHYRIDNADSSMHSPSKVFCICDEYKVIQDFLDARLDLKSKLQSMAEIFKFRDYIGHYKRLTSVFQYALLIRISTEFQMDEKSGLLKECEWKTEDWEELHHVMYEPEAYFMATGKDFRDERVELFSTLNANVYCRGLIETILEYENVLIYGAGLVGKQILTALRTIKPDIPISAFIVADIYNNPKEICGLQVHNAEAFVPKSNRCLILIATREKDQGEIMNKLDKLGFKNIVSMDRNLRKALSERTAEVNI